ncbi:MAG: signal peptidase I [candidate division KSB1 bacterium]|nr:signal peptidase I [candidate division KSB1 bacterium]MDZ7337029.1 signal peptidase I [candidate division KSB1 bacterium]MDZ7378013.1 signal peptidase I [candidate division KSB1 bacterium]MDZ7384694.1 signal peptidase I [candidate division KSB1 bacterium]MDZ7392263.1 signal peptidase I [candidate division KSB1 bacterium]
MQQPTGRKKSVIHEYAEAVAVAVIAALILRLLVIQAFRIPTGSMKDTLLIGDFLMVNKFIYGVRTPSTLPLVKANIPHFRFPAVKKPKRGEVIVFKYPLDQRLDYIKRCVGLPGDTIEVRNGDLYVNGKPEGTKELVGRRYDPEDGHYVVEYRITTPQGQKYNIRHYDFRGRTFDNFGPIVVPPGHLFMMGDNRDNSADSRFWGPLPFDNVVGEAMVIYFSWDSRAPVYNLLKKIRWTRLGKIIR